MSDKLQTILAGHSEWLAGDDNGQRADLSDADLSVANLRGAEGVIYPPINDPRGYRCVAVRHTDGWRIAAGCRWLTVPDALAHWGAEYRGDRAIGDAYLFAMRWVAGQSATRAAATEHEATK